MWLSSLSRTWKQLKFGAEKHIRKTTTIAIVLAAGIATVSSRSPSSASVPAAKASPSTTGDNSPIINGSANSTVMIGPLAPAVPRRSADGEPERDVKQEQRIDPEDPDGLSTTGNNSPIVSWSPGTTIIIIEESTRDSWNSLIVWLRDLRIESNDTQRSLIIESERFAAMSVEQLSESNMAELIQNAKALASILGQTQPDLVPKLNHRVAQALHMSGHHEEAITLAPPFLELKDPEPEIERHLQNSALDVRAGAHAALGQWADALHAWERIRPQGSLDIRARIALCHLNLGNTAKALQVLVHSEHHDDTSDLLLEAAAVMDDYPLDYIASLVWFAIGQAALRSNEYDLADEALLAALAALEQQPTLGGWNKDLDKALILQELANARINALLEQPKGEDRSDELRAIRDLSNEARALLTSVLLSGVSAPDALNNFILSCWTGMTIAAQEGRYDDMSSYLLDAAYVAANGQIRQLDPATPMLTAEESAQVLLGMRGKTAELPSLEDGELAVDLVKMALLSAALSEDGHTLSVLLGVVENWEGPGFVANQSAQVPLDVYAKNIRRYAEQNGVVLSAAGGG